MDENLWQPQGDPGTQQQNNNPVPSTNPGMGYRPPVSYSNSNGFVTAAFTCGILAIVTTICMTVYLPFIFGGLSIIFGVLSKREPNVPMLTKAKTGIICGVGGLVLNLALIVFCVNMVMTNPEYRNQLNEACEEMYGYTFDEMLEDMQQELGK